MDTPIYLWVIILLIIAGGVALLYASDSHAFDLKEESTLAHLVRDIGMALVIAGFLAGTFEGYFRRRTEHHTTLVMGSLAHETLMFTVVIIQELRNESEYVYLERRMAPQVLSELKTHITNRHCLRKGHRLFIRLDPTEDSQITAYCTSEYDIENSTDEITEYPVEVYLADLHPPARIIESIKIAENYPEMKITLFDREKLTKMFDLAEKSGDRVEDSGGRLAKWSEGWQLTYPVTLAPRTQGSQSEASVEAHYEIKTALPWQHPWMIPTPQDGLALTIEHPADVEVGAWITHPQPEKFKKLPTETAGLRPGDTSNRLTDRWEMEGVFLPYQSIIMDWKRSAKPE